MQELFEKIDALYTEFKADHVKGNKASMARARKAIGEIKKLVTEYRKLSVEAAKSKWIVLL